MGAKLLPQFFLIFLGIWILRAFLYILFRSNESFSVAMSFIRNELHIPDRFQQLWSFVHIGFHTYRLPYISASIHIGFRTYQLSSISASIHIGFHTYRLPYISAFVHIGFSESLSADRKLIRHYGSDRCVLWPISCVGVTVVWSAIQGRKTLQTKGDYP